MRDVLTLTDFKKNKKVQMFYERVWVYISGRRDDHLIDDEFSFKDGHEVFGLFSHHHSDLCWSSIVFVIQIHSLIRTCCHLILCGMTALENTRLCHLEEHSYALMWYTQYVELQKNLFVIHHSF